MKKIFRFLSLILTLVTFSTKSSDIKQSAYHEAGHAVILHAKIKEGLPCRIEYVQLAQQLGIISSNGKVAFICDSRKIDKNPELSRMLTQVFLGGAIGEQTLENKRSKNFAQILNRTSTLDDRVQAQKQCDKIRSQEALTNDEKMEIYMQATTNKDLQYVANLQIMNEEYDKALQSPNLQSNIVKLAKILEEKRYLSGTQVNEFLK